MMRSLALVLATGLLASACAMRTAPPAPIENFMSIIDPGGPGLRAAAILVPGCDGTGPNVAFAAERLAREGFVVLTLDYPSARRIDADCTPAQTAGIADDILRAATLVRRQPNVDPAKLHLVGWAEGGAGVMAALDNSALAAGIGARSAAAFYPVCTRLSSWRARVPFLMLLAETDTLSPPQTCYDLAERAEGSDKVLAIRYGNVGNRFDVPDKGRTFWQPWRGEARFSEAVRDAALHDLGLFFVDPKQP